MKNHPITQDDESYKYSNNTWIQREKSGLPKKNIEHRFVSEKLCGLRLLVERALVRRALLSRADRTYLGLIDCLDPLPVDLVGLGVGLRLSHHVLYLVLRHRETWVHTTPRGASMEYITMLVTSESQKSRYPGPTPPKYYAPPLPKYNIMFMYHVLYLVLATERDMFSRS